MRVLILFIPRKLRHAYPNFQQSLGVPLQEFIGHLESVPDPLELLRVMFLTHDLESEEVTPEDDAVHDGKHAVDCQMGPTLGMLEMVSL